MDRYWEANSVQQPPTVPSQSAGGFPTDGSPAASAPPTTPGAWWYHVVSEEIRNAIVALGVSPDFTKTDQLAQALIAALAATAVSIHYDDLIGKPALAPVATSGSYSDLTGKPAIPAAQVNADWNAGSGVAAILNRPALAPVATSGNYNDLSNRPPPATNNPSVGTANALVFDWFAPSLHLYVDGQDEGQIYSSVWWSPQTVGAVGYYELVEQGSTGNPGDLINGLHRQSGVILPGTWMNCGGGQTSNNNWDLWLRIA